MVEQLPERAHPPLYYLLAWPWSRLFGTGEVGLRSLSAVFGTAMVPVAYRVGAALASRRVGIILAALVAFSPFMVWYSQEARPYTLLALAAALSFLALVHALEDPRTRWLIAWLVFSALAMATHYYAALFVAVEALVLLVAHRSRRAALAAVGVAGVAAISTLPLALAQIGRGNVDWLETLKLVPRLRETVNWFLGGPYLGLHQQLILPVLLLWLVVGALAGIGIYLVIRRTSAQERKAGGLAATVGAATLVLALLLAVVGQDFVVGRYLITAWLPLAASIAVGFGASRSHRWAAAAAGVACLLWLVVVMVTASVTRFQRDNWRAAASALGSPIDSRLILVKGGGGSASSALDFYLPDAHPFDRGIVRVDELALVDMRRSRWARDPIPPTGSTEIDRIVTDNLRVYRFRFKSGQRIRVTASPAPHRHRTLGLVRSSRCDAERCLRGYLVDGVGTP